jgi:hypothetical protein
LYSPKMRKSIPTAMRRPVNALVLDIAVRLKNER